MVASDVIGRFLQGRAQDEVDGSAKQLLRLTCHFEQSGGGHRQRLVERHQEVHIAAGSGLAARRRAKNLQPADVVLLAKGTQAPPQLISVLCFRTFAHSGRIACAQVNFKQGRALGRPGLPVASRLAGAGPGPTCDAASGLRPTARRVPGVARAFCTAQVDCVLGAGMDQRSAPP
jgi:hypothetical protein